MILAVFLSIGTFFFLAERFMPRRPEQPLFRQGFLTERDIAGEDRPLIEQSEAQTFEEGNLAPVGLFAFGDEAEESRFAGAIAADKPDAFSGVDLEGHAA